VAVSFKKWPRGLLLLFLLPFALTLIAAAMHRYPYGGSARIAQHLGPAICLWAGLGAAWLIERLRDEKRRHLAVVMVFGLLAAVGIVGIVHDFLRPSKTPGDARARARVREWTSPAEETRAFVVWEPMMDVAPNFQWYLRCSGREIVWNGREDTTWSATSGPINLLSFDPNAALAERLVGRLPGFRVTAFAFEKILVGPPELGPHHLESVRLEPLPPGPR
jgi:hypothetical protein